jgi:acyl-[acyl-carrier-protein]-phospholipid O-acyltransferase/long-chain-fatty-acid--[acyl-carrier-protein] ligase
VKIDPDGFVIILGRAKRFSKIAGEMVSLGLVEQKLKQAFPQAEHAVVAVPDARRGEQLVMFTTDPALDQKAVMEGLKSLDTSAMLVPRNVITLAEMPLLGSGKTDYQSLIRMAHEQVKP